MTEHRNPFAEPLVIALLALLLSLLIVACLIVYRLNSAGPKDAAEIGVYGSLIGVFTASIGAVVQALSRDPATARANAQAAATNATTLAAVTPNAPPTPAAPPAPVEVVGPGGGPVQTEEART